MGVRLRTTLAATAVVAAALCVASVALFAAIDASLADSTRKAAVQDADKKAARVVFLAQSPTGDVTKYSCGGGGGGGARDGASGKQTGGKAGQDNCRDVGPDPDGGAGKYPGGQAPPGKGTVAGQPAGSKVAIDAAGIPKVTRVTKLVETEHGLVSVTGTASTEPARAALATLKTVLLPGVPALLALVALATWLAVGRALRPVSAIRAKVADITAYDLHERVPEPDTRDEIAALARTVNTTLDRLRTAVEAHRQFVADAAHELRSPMAILRTRLELARPAERKLAAAALDDVGRLQSLTADLLLLARLDAREPLRAEELDLAQVVAEEAARTRPRTDVRVALDLVPDVLVDGSSDRLRRLVANLVDNAVRHATARVDVVLTIDSAQAVLEVVDDGPGIPPEHRTTIFDRFTRLDHARARDTGGSGLGLPIARDIARAHGGTLEVVPNVPGGYGGPGAAVGPAGPGARLRTVLPLAGRGALGRAAVAVPVPVPVGG
ncbi:sensor histidine kinase [Streptomyces odontomachi]|uniref:sensor histidine kinase n=1 Tax=Streptomyces odontomachi TaxID=2944940 RepID=UPI002109B1D4|nr:HAMP domain-containing sensor histidine kinase [Streptomyces sp. ODS25]